MATVTKPMALDETLQSTNGKMDSVINKLQGIIEALGVDTSVYKAAGNKTCAELLPALLVAGNLGNVYNITDSGTTTSDFVEGAGKEIHIGDNVAVVDIGTVGTHVYKFDLLAGMVDLTNYIEKSSTAGLVKNDGTIDTNQYATTSQIPDISVKADKVASATNGNLAGLDANGNLTDSGIVTTDVEEMQDELSTDYATIEGNPINFSTLSAQNAKSTIIDLEPIQDLHGYDKPWVGGAGKNLFNPDASSKEELDLTGGGVIRYGHSFDSGAYTLINTGTEASSHTSYFYRTPKKDMSDRGSAVQIIDNSSVNVTVDNDHLLWVFTNEETLRDANKIAVIEGSNKTFEPYENICPITGRSEISILGTNGKESTDPDYEVSNDLTISLGQTVYGGTLDVEKGVLVATKILKLYTGDSSESWGESELTGKHFLYAAVPANCNVSQTVICDRFKGKNDYRGNLEDGEISIASDLIWFYIRWESHPSLSDWKTSLASNSLQVCYELATPITINLAPHTINLLKGVNNISTDGDKITLTYRDGSVATLGDLTSAVDELDGKIEDSKILTDTVTGDKYILVVTNGVLSVEQISN